MGIGDNIMASGMARGAAARRKRIAFGDGQTIIWDRYSEMVFRNNPNVAVPGSEGSRDLEWIAHYRGNRAYNRQGHGKWIWNCDFHATPGEIFLSRDERKFGERTGNGFVVIEPTVPTFKSVAPNKRWPTDRFDRVALDLRIAGLEVIQLTHGQGHRISSAKHLETPDIRYALAVLEQAALYIGPEGGLHHGAAAVGVPAVVLFGGFVPPSVTGYSTHTNLTGGAEACGSIHPCEHCRAAMQAIAVEEVMGAAMQYLTQPRVKNGVALNAE